MENYGYNNLLRGDQIEENLNVFRRKFKFLQIQEYLFGEKVKQFHMVV
jgi:hypothetical protein